ncbi:MAG: SDR family NAD(P)-dependent oxidoreductase [Actinomycetales bacterium]|nr:SDR family NAD(P)-dependent oxidoreductase [Actinomycetales bacterium]
MASILVTGSSDGIGLESVLQLLAAGHRVVGHARDAQRAEDLRAVVPGVAEVVVGDLASLAQTKALAAAAEAAGPFDAVIHNAGVGGGSPRTPTADGLERIFQVNTVAPYVLTALMPAPARLVYLTSGLEAQGRLELEDLSWEAREWDGMQAYADSKLHDVLLAFAVARLWPGTLANAVDPGWIKTRLGGPNAWDEVDEGAATQVWLAASADPGARVTGEYLKRFEIQVPHPVAREEAAQDALLERLEQITGVPFPRP